MKYIGTFVQNKHVLRCHVASHAHHSADQLPSRYHSDLVNLFAEATSTVKQYETTQLFLLQNFSDAAKNIKQSVFAVSLSRSKIKSHLLDLVEGTKHVVVLKFHRSQELLQFLLPI